jgi:hypothetical protein
VSSLLRTLSAGALIAATSAVLVLTGDALGVDDAWPVLLVVGAGLLVGVPLLRHAISLAVGIAIGTFTAWLELAVLPDVAAGRAIGTATAVLLITVATLVTRARLRFGLQLVGWAAMTALIAARATPVPATTLGTTGLGGLIPTAVTLLVATGIGLLLAQVAQLVASGTGRDRGSTAVVAAVAAASIGLTLTAGSPAAAGADARDGTIQHRQTVVRDHAADGRVVGGSIVTRLATVDAGDVVVVLRDQGVEDLRDLSRFGRHGVEGTDVTRTLVPGGTSRSIATLQRTLPIDVAVRMTLDGVVTTPADVVGRSGRLEVAYTLTNRSVEPREIRFFDGAGRSRTVTRDVAVPFVGGLVVRFDDRFTAVRSSDGRLEDRSAVAAGAGVELLVDLVLAAPLGSPERTVVWSADIRDGAIPPVSIRLAPITLGSTAAGRAEGWDSERFSDAVRDISEAGGLVRTGLTALAAGGATNGTDGSIIATSRAALDALLASASGAGADVNESRAFVEAQDRRVLAGDGAIHGLLHAGDVRPAGPAVDADVVYLLEIAGQDADGGPGVPLRLGLAVLLMGAVGLLGRAIGDRTGTTRPDPTRPDPTTRHDGGDDDE